MKANALEKIYLQENTTTDCYGEFWPEWFEARAKYSDIEYTRTDAFIEKAEEFLEDHLTEEGCKFGSSEWVEVKSNFESIDSFIMAFKYYIKGE